MTFKDLIGKPAPAFKLKNYDGEDYEVKPGTTGLPIILFFYPASGSYGCTREACQFRDAVAEKVDFAAEKVQIVGISPDPVEKQKEFVEKQKLTYPVLSDLKQEAVSAYGIGKGMWGLTPVARVTFIIDRKGVLRDAHDATMNYGAHLKFAEKWVNKLKAEDNEAAPAVAD